MIKIKIKGKEYKISQGLTLGSDLYSLAKLADDDKLLLNIKNEVDISVSKGDYIILKGDEQFVIGKSDVEDNPKLKQSISLKLNKDDITIDKPKITGADIRKKGNVFDNSCWLYVDLPDCPNQLIKDGFNLIVSSNDCFITIPVFEGAIDIEECTKHDLKPPKHQQKYRIKIDGKKYTVPNSHLSGKEIIALTGKEWQRYDLQQKFKGGKRVAIEPRDNVDFSTHGVERFETVPRQAQQG